jgi:hypothetical protein
MPFSTDVTTMPHINSLAASIISDYPYHFVIGDDFKWSPLTSTIFYPPLTSPEDIWSFLHEVSHAELRHTDYLADVQLVNNEAQAWKHAATVLAHRYNVSIDQDYIEDHLDTYRIWLHQRSTCPDCSQNGLQTKNTYSCINCRCVWRVNEARLCALRRVTLRDQSLT